MKKQLIGFTIAGTGLAALHFAFMYQPQERFDEIEHQMKIMYVQCLAGDSNEFYGCEDIRKAIQHRREVRVKNQVYHTTSTVDANVSRVRSGLLQRSNHPSVRNPK